MADLLGTSPDLNGDYTFTRLNPMVGLAYKITAKADGLWRLFGVQPRADAARARLLQPEQALPARRLPGVRSAAATGRRARPTRPDCAARARSATAASNGRSALFRTDSDQRHHQRRELIQGRGVFQNVDATRRQGLEAGAQYRAAMVRLCQLQLHRRDLPVQRR